MGDGMMSDGNDHRRSPVVEVVSNVPDVADVLARFVEEPGVLLFESSAARGDAGRYSFLTADPIWSFQAESPDHTVDEHFQQFRELLSRYRFDDLPDLPPFQGGLAGLMSYELGQAWEKWPRAQHDEFRFPALCVGFYDWVYAWDHVTGKAWIIVQPVGNETQFAARIDWIKQKLKSPPHQSPITSHQSPTPLAPQFPFEDQADITSDFSRDGYLRAVEHVIENIHAGEIFQANLSQRLLIPQRTSPFELYQRLRTVNPAPFSGYFAVDDWAIVSASPERFLMVDGDAVETRPIKGTRKRQSGPEADLFTRDELRESDKDRAENVMIVDLLRNDLSRVCRPHSIRVSKLCNVETYETVQHLVSQIHGQLEDSRDVWDLFRASFPGGSITGAPKVRAMEIISETEPTARGPYCGSLFYAGFNGKADSSILIRTFLCRHGWIQCPVGGGVVAQSDPVAEYEETLHKAAGMLRAV